MQKKLMVRVSYFYKEPPGSLKSKNLVSPSVKIHGSPKVNPTRGNK